MAKGLTNGDPAPPLKGTSVMDGAEVELKALSEKYTIVVFSRYFGCPVCQSDFDKLLAHESKILEKANIIYVTQSSETSAKEFLEKKGGGEFPVICDPQAPYPIYQAWHVGNVTLGMLPKMQKAAKGYTHGPKEGNERQSPADFIIDTNGKIIAANYDLLDIDGIMKMVDLW
jgi:peroxiredoxin